MSPIALQYIFLPSEIKRICIFFPMEYRKSGDFDGEKQFKTKKTINL